MSRSSSSSGAGGRCKTCKGSGRVPAPTSHDGLVACPDCDGQGTAAAAAAVAKRQPEPAAEPAAGEA